MKTGVDPGGRGERRVGGRVLEALPNALYRVELHGGVSVLAHVETTLRPLLPRLIPGDEVEVVISPFDVARGRIVARARRSGPRPRGAGGRDEDGER